MLVAAIERRGTSFSSYRDSDGVPGENQLRDAVVIEVVGSPRRGRGGDKRQRTAHEQRDTARTQHLRADQTGEPARKGNTVTHRQGLRR